MNMNLLIIPKNSPIGVGDTVSEENVMGVFQVTGLSHYGHQAENILSGQKAMHIKEMEGVIARPDYIVPNGAIARPFPKLS